MNTVILEERENVLVLLTGLESSKNDKTGDMLQVYILVRNQHPIDAIRNGSDAAICGDCRLRGENGKAESATFRSIMRQPQCGTLTRGERTGGSRSKNSPIWCPVGT